MGIISEYKLFPILILIKHPKETSDYSIEKIMPAKSMCKNDLPGNYC